MHKNTRNPFEACKELGAQSSGTASARLGSLFTAQRHNVKTPTDFPTNLCSEATWTQPVGSWTTSESIILENEELPKIFLDFLSIRHFPSLPKAESCGSFEEIESEESSKLSHQPVLLFLRDPYVLPAANDDFPNVVIEGVLRGLFYPHLQPR
ncbi:sorting nexin-24 isoform X2 [Podarcis muralis]